MLKYILERAIKFYISTHQTIPHRRTCVFHPTCSEYALGVIERYGIWRGGQLMCRRLLRCHPWQKNNYDPIP